MFDAVDFSDDDAPVVNVKATPSAPVRRDEEPLCTRQRPRTAPAPVRRIHAYHVATDREFTPVALPLAVQSPSPRGVGRRVGAQTGPSADDVADTIGDAWANRDCHCLRCEIIRLGVCMTNAAAAWAAAVREVRESLPSAADAIADSVFLRGQNPRRGPRTERGDDRAVGPQYAGPRDESQDLPLLSPITPSSRTIVPAFKPAIILLDLDNFGFPQFKQPAPPSLLQLLGSGTVFVWALFGVGFQRYFQVDPRDYYTRIPSSNCARILARCVANVASARIASPGPATVSAVTSTGNDDTVADRPTRRARVETTNAQSPIEPNKKRARGQEYTAMPPGGVATSRTPRAGEERKPGCSTWAALRAAQAVHFTPCGAQSQAADNVLMDATALAVPEYAVFIATGDRDLQAAVRQVAAAACPEGRLEVIPTASVPTTVEFWDAVASLLAGSPLPE
jgi:hypothetical protein